MDVLLLFCWYSVVSDLGYTDLADWWVAILINGMICYQTSDGGWACPQPPAYTPINPQIRARQKLENAAGYYPLLSITPPAGTYTMCFGVDLNPDGILNSNPLYYSCNVITIQP